jgi:hypothetical protein
VGSFTTVSSEPQQDHKYKLETKHKQLKHYHIGIGGAIMQKRETSTKKRQ